ncbi:hypothetical protein [Litorivivens sp.]|uniref:hypothetical protein n=1 Tax=Litorivivens sp. TaxID=2020868 RepID=UPI00356979D3
MKKYYSSGLVLMLLITASSLAWSDYLDGMAVYSVLSSDTYSDAAPIEQMLHDLEGAPVRSGDFAYTHNQLEVGVSRGDWAAAVFVRYDYFVEFNDDTVALAYLKKNNATARGEAHYDIDLSANHLRSRGLATAYRFSVHNDWTGQVKVSYVEAWETTYGELSGSVITRDDDFSADLYLDYSYTEDTFLNRPREQVDGKGATLDLELQWQVNDKLQFGFSSRDLLSLIRFDDVTYTRAVATTNRISYDENGRLRSVPALSGEERYRNEIQRFPRRVTLSAGYQYWSQWRLRGELFAIDRYLFPRLGLERDLALGNLHLDYDLEAKAIGVALRKHWYAIQLRTDHTNWDEMDKLEFSLQFNWRL